MKGKILLVAFALFFFLSLAPQGAQAYISNTQLKDDLKAPEYQGGSFSFYSITKTIESLNALIIGTGDEDVDKEIGTSAIKTTGNLITALYANPPASSAYYLADLGQRLNIIQPAYAQGIGFSGLRPLLPLWRASRNIAYIFFILIFIITGFSIMFRAKIDPQTVVTIQAAIPKVIIALILVTFSYAIAGLMIDLMYLLIGLFFGILPASFKATLPHSDNLSYYYTGGFGEILHQAWDAGWGSFWRVFSNVWAESMGTMTAITAIATVIAATFSGPAGWVALIAGGSAAILPLLIVGIIILLTTVKIFWTLLVSYINIIIGVLIAPFQLMLSAIPGQNTFGLWVSNLLKNILVFPATVAMFTLAFVFCDLSEISPGANLWTPPLLGFWGEKTGQAIGGLLGFGIILMTPKVADIIKGMFEKKPFPYGAAIGQAMGAPFKATGAILTGAGQTVESIGKISDRWRKRKEAGAGGEGEGSGGTAGSPASSTGASI